MRNPQRSVFSRNIPKQKTKELIAKVGKILVMFVSLLISLLLLSWSVMMTQPVMAATASSSADFTAYNVPGETGPAAINSKTGTISVMVAQGANVSALVATFTTSAGVSAVAVGAVPQASGKTPNNFTNPVTYTITAQDGTTKKNWTVTVTAPNGAADTNDGGQGGTSSTI